MIRVVLKGGPGSGNYGHAGRIGKIGGSAPKSGVGAMLSLRTGKTAAQRQAAAAYRSPMQPSVVGEPGAPPEMSLDWEDLEAFVFESAGVNELDELLDYSFGNTDPTEFPAQRVKRMVVNDVYNGLPDEYKEQITKKQISQMLGVWADGSNSGSVSASMHEAAAEEFGTSVSKWQTSQMGTSNTGIMPRAHERAVLRSMYNNTQDKLADAGFSPNDKITLYRGIAIDNSVQFGNVAKMDSNAMESWTSDWSIANQFGVMPIMEYMDNGSPYILSQAVPVKNIVGSCVTGFGCAGELEFVVLGDTNATVGVHKGSANLL